MERYSRRDGLRLGRGSTAELVNTDPVGGAGGGQQQATRRIDAAYRAWARARDDLEVLRLLHTAVTDYLQEHGGAL
jgi:aminoglycoside phosphotransferase (APT) family kinase protein